jgi:hypothetical protein
MADVSGRRIHRSTQSGRLCQCMSGSNSQAPHGARVYREMRDNDPTIGKRIRVRSSRAHDPDKSNPDDHQGPGSPATGCRRVHPEAYRGQERLA